jgi:energy-converting hydrogenase Eha subunit A
VTNQARRRDNSDLLTIVTAATGAFWLTIPLAYGFWARVLTGPRLSPLGQLAKRVIAPRLGAPKIVPGPPKRFAQAMGAAMSTTALVLGLETAATVVLLVLAAAASLEAFAGLCLGCEIFRLGMRAGIVPETVCLECADIWSRGRASA